MPVLHGCIELRENRRHVLDFLVQNAHDQARNHMFSTYSGYKMTIFERESYWGGVSPPSKKSFVIDWLSLAKVFWQATFEPLMTAHGYHQGS